MEEAEAVKEKTLAGLGLSAAQIEAVFQDYDEGLQPGKIVTKHGIPVVPSALHRYIPPLVTDADCCRCGEKMVLYKRNRTVGDSTNPPTCPNCGHRTLEVHECSCDAVSYTHLTLPTSDLV